VIAVFSDIGRLGSGGRTAKCHFDIVGVGRGFLGEGRLGKFASKRIRRIVTPMKLYRRYLRTDFKERCLKTRDSARTAYLCSENNVSHFMGQNPTKLPKIAANRHFPVKSEKS